MSEEIKKDPLTIANAVKRFNDPMPNFFKTIQKVALTIGGIGAAIMTASAAVVFPPLLLTIAGYMIAVGAVGTALTQFTSTTPNQPAP